MIFLLVCIQIVVVVIVLFGFTAAADIIREELAAIQLELSELRKELNENGSV